MVWVPILLACVLLAVLLMDNLPLHSCGSFPVAAAKYLWLELLGFAGAAAGIVLMMTLPLPDLIKMFVVMLFAVALTLLLMRFVTPRAIRGNLVKQFAVFRNKHNWIMTWLYTMTFGSFIGYSAAFPKLIADVFGYAARGCERRLAGRAAEAGRRPQRVNVRFPGRAGWFPGAACRRLAQRPLRRRAASRTGTRGS